MREIKFRAWDKKNNQYAELWSINYKAWDGDGEINYYQVQGDGMEDRAEHEVVLEQYTGLKDKNGKEIYEGDIVRRKQGYCGNPNIPTDERVQKVEYCKAGYYYLLSSDIYELEVIGDIHENPELLDEEKK